MTLRARTEALLSLVEQDRRAQCESIAARSEAQATELLAATRRRTRERAHDTLVEERRRARAALEAARAELATRQRQHTHRRLDALLTLGWRRLPEVLRERWQQADTRALWLRATLEHARRVLPCGPWSMASAPDWPDDERERCLQQLGKDLGCAPRWESDAHIEAGLRVTADGNVFDATLAGLLADRDEIGARLVGLFEQTAPAEKVGA